jgi:hypothetical protein
MFKKKKNQVAAYDDEEPDDEKSSKPGQVSPSNDKSKGGISHNRKCRDVPFLILFIIFWVIMIL